jgi:multidrug efflux pump subunit AcrA (membrane-fusion protein)
MKSVLLFLRRHTIGILILVCVFIAVRWVVNRYRKPGSMTLIQAQAMNMNMTAPVGALPVGAITVSDTFTQPTVEYTGNVVPYNGIIIYPRVTGVLKAVYVYPGQRVHAGQVVAMLDSVEFNSRLKEAEYGSQAAKDDYLSLVNLRKQGVAQQGAAAANLQAYQSDYQNGLAQVAAAESALKAAQSEYQASQADLAVAESALNSANANAQYWKSEIVRERKLYRSKAVSMDEMQAEEAKYRTALANVQQAQATIAQKRARIATSQANIQQMEAGLQSAKSKLTGLQAQIASAKAALTASEANVAAISEQIKRQASLEKEASAKQNTASIIRNYTLIRVDQGGVVTQRLVSPGTLVQPGMPILQIDNTSALRIQADVAQSDIVNIHNGNPVTIKDPVLPNHSIKARVTSIFDSSNDVSRTVVVEALVRNPPSWLIPGEYVVMDIGLGVPRKMISIPYSAIRYDEFQHPFVWTIRQVGQSGKTTYTCLMHPFIHEDHPGKCPICGMTLVPEKNGGKSVAHRVYVTLGVQSNNSVQVVSGLNAGDIVITQGNDGLQEGQNVAVEQWSEGGPVSLPKPSGNMKSMPGMNMPMNNGVGGASSGSMNGTNTPSTSTNHGGTNGSMSGMNMPSGSGNEKPSSGAKPEMPVQSNPNESNSMKNMPGM